MERLKMFDLQQHLEVLKKIVLYDHVVSKGILRT